MWVKLQSSPPRAQTPPQARRPDRFPLKRRIGPSHSRSGVAPARSSPPPTPLEPSRNSTRSKHSFGLPSSHRKMSTRRSARLGSTSTASIPALPTPPSPTLPKRKQQLLTESLQASKKTKLLKPAKSVPAPIPARPLLPETTTVLAHAPLCFDFALARAHLEATDSRWGELMDRLRCRPYQDTDDQPFNPFKSVTRSYTGLKGWRALTLAVCASPRRALVSSLIGQQISWIAARSVQHKVNHIANWTAPSHAEFCPSLRSSPGCSSPPCPTSRHTSRRRRKRHSRPRLSNPSPRPGISSACPTQSLPCALPGCPARRHLISSTSPPGSRTAGWTQRRCGGCRMRRWRSSCWR